MADWNSVTCPCPDISCPPRQDIHKYSFNEWITWLISLLHDVQRLMDIGFGDDRILRQIYRACKNNEAISNYERNYVRTLVDEHLTKSAQIPEPEPEKEIPGASWCRGSKSGPAPTGGEDQATTWFQRHHVLVDEKKGSCLALQRYF